MEKHGDDLSDAYLPYLYQSGLPDSLLGTVWPVMRLELGAALDTAGMISIIISGGTIISSLFSGRIIRRFGTGRVTAVSILLTATVLAGGLFVHRTHPVYHQPPGHCLPAPVEKVRNRRGPAGGGEKPEPEVIPKKDGALGIPGVIQALITFSLYCMTEYTLGLWGQLPDGDEGIYQIRCCRCHFPVFRRYHPGRLLTGVLTLRVTGTRLIRGGLTIITIGAVLLLLPLRYFALPALLLIGFGCTPA
jgi:hypothetical protein